MSWIELVQVEAHLFYPGDAVGDLANPDTSYKEGVFYFDAYDRVFPSLDYVDSFVAASSVLTKHVVGFNFCFISQQVEDAYHRMLGYDCEQNGYDDTIDNDDCLGLLRIAHHVIATCPRRPEESIDSLLGTAAPPPLPRIRHVEFLAVWSCDAWADCDGEYDASTDLYGFINLRNISLQITTLDQIPEPPTP